MRKYLVLGIIPPYVYCIINMKYQVQYIQCYRDINCQIKHGVFLINFITKYAQIAFA